MTLLEKLQRRREVKAQREKEIREKNERGFDKDIKLEKGDVLAIVIAGFINFVMPIMLLVSLACLLAYLFFAVF